MKIVFLGAGSTVFVKNVLGDCMLAKGIRDFEVALVDIDKERMEESYEILCALRNKYKPGLEIKKYDANEEKQIREAFAGAKYIVNAIQVGGYEPCTVTDFETPKKYGLRQTIGDTIGIGGIFRALRTMPVMKRYADIMEEICPNVYFLNYVNPMSILTGYMQRNTKINTLGLCHSCQVVLSTGSHLGIEGWDTAEYTLAGINHMCWLLSVKDRNGKDLYPEFKKRFNEEKKYDLVRLEIMNRFGYYNTESSEHTAEYHPYFIKKDHPELLEHYQIPLDEYPRRCIEQIEKWKKQKEDFKNPENICHTRSKEYCSRIIEAIETGIPYKIYANVQNTDLITNLPKNACVEVPIMVDGSGYHPCHVGDLPDELAGLNMSHIAVHNMVIKAMETLQKEYIYKAAYLDPHTRDQLTFDEIKNLCDDMIEAHKGWLPEFH